MYIICPHLIITHMSSSMDCRELLNDGKSRLISQLAAVLTRGITELHTASAATGAEVRIAIYLSIFYGLKVPWTPK